ncbi:MAG: hypothetical protein ACLFMW_05750, partial [Ectothiorhodospira sp.]
ERIAPGTEAAVLLEGLPSAADRVGLDTALEALPGLAQRLDDRRRRLAQLDRTARESDREPAEVDPAAREALEQALRQARALGDVDARIRDLETVIDAWAREQTQALRDLEQDDIEALRAAHPFLEAEIDEMARTLEDHGAQLERLDREWTQIRAEREEQRLRQEQLAAVGEVVTAETLRAARERRDALWKRIRRDWVEGAVLSGADPQEDPVRAYEQAVDRADHQADQLRADAARAAGIQECRTRIHRMEARLEEITGERQRRQEALETQRTRWEAECARRGLPPLDPAALGQWQQRREAVLEAGGRLERQRLQRDREAAAREAVARALSGALERLGQRPPGADLGALIRTATDWEHEATARDARREERRHAARERDREREALSGEIAELEACRGDHTRVLADWHARLHLPEDAPPAAVRARLEELDALERLRADLEALREGQARQRALVDAFAQRARELARLLQEPDPEDAEDMAARLRDRLRAAVDRDRERRTLERDLTRARAEEARAREVMERQESVLEHLAAAAGVPRAQLPEVEARAAHKRRVRDRLREGEGQLSRSSQRPEAALRASLEGLDLAAIESDQARCRAGIEGLEADVKTARQREEAARRALEAVDTSDAAARAREAMESAAAGMAAAIPPWARLRIAHALLRRALDRFRERSQGPMVEAASRHFALMTRGRYPRLETDDTQDPPVLRAVREDDRRVDVDGMSEGTRDQLYLALRLAALELRRAAQPGMPLILDDVLMTTDDERAARVLQALAAFAEGGQVLLLTHHRHLLDVARAAVGDARLCIHRLDA